jgi:hypothetical protein
MKPSIPWDTRLQRVMKNSSFMKLEVTACMKVGFFMKRPVYEIEGNECMKNLVYENFSRWYETEWE